MKVHLYLPALRNPIAIEILIPVGADPEQYVQSVMNKARWNWPGGQMETPIEKKKGRPRLTAERLPPKFKRCYAYFVKGRLNISQMAELCGLTRPTIYKYIRLIQEEAKRDEHT